MADLSPSCILNLHCGLRQVLSTLKAQFLHAWSEKARLGLQGPLAAWAPWCVWTPCLGCCSLGPTTSAITGSYKYPHKKRFPHDYVFASTGPERRGCCGAPGAPRSSRPAWATWLWETWCPWTTGTPWATRTSCHPGCRLVLSGASFLLPLPFAQGGSPGWHVRASLSNGIVCWMEPTFFKMGIILIG